ncbi:G kinase-anchoring protein 1-like isoform X2 [Malaya genurostris]|uniref:G kinase-anchoring protein 1-like isoform X2 n=1 Tax=Malaya genurostris TaxID=325434 RepID=UPI0026F3ADBC|nr:G kinase-anchoring protein 1-like isoform X2 [Malaya genurostris]
MVSIVPSRFAGLRIEDDDEEFATPKQKSNASLGTKTAGNTKQAGSHQNSNQKKSKPKVKKTVNAGVQQEQWSKWQAKDSEIVESNYEKDLEQALMLSKLDFEANKTKLSKPEKESKQPGKPKKARPLSLQQFQSKVDRDSTDKEAEQQCKEAEVLYNKKFTFFEQIDMETKQIIQKEQFKSLISTRGYSTGKKSSENEKPESPSPNSSEIDTLKTENAALRAELELVRTRLKKVCSILKTGEMKDKSELLIEIEKLKKNREDMITEMTALYAQLEQEKSKTGGSNHERGKERTAVRKSVRFDASTEVHNGRAD